MHLGLVSGLKRGWFWPESQVESWYLELLVSGQVQLIDTCPGTLAGRANHFVQMRVNCLVGLASIMKSFFAILKGNIRCLVDMVFYSFILSFVQPEELC